MLVDNYVAIFRNYTDMTIYLLGNSEDNELVLGIVLDCLHECWDRIFKHNIERKSLINNMSGVILVIDELLDTGIVMHTDPNVILARISTKKAQSAAQPAAQDSSASLFSSMFSAAKGSLAKSMGM